jgi:hypothetical protein
VNELNSFLAFRFTDHEFNYIDYFLLCDCVGDIICLQKHAAFIYAYF